MRPSASIRAMSRNRSADLLLASFWNVSRAMENPRGPETGYLRLHANIKVKKPECVRAEIIRACTNSVQDVGPLYAIVPSGQPSPAGFI